MTATNFDVVIDQPVIDVVITEYTEDVIVVTGPRGLKGDVGPGVDVYAEVLTGDGSTSLFQLEYRTLSDLSVQVFRNGLAEVVGIGFMVSSDAAQTFVSFTSAPLADDEVQVVYHV